MNDLLQFPTQRKPRWSRFDIRPVVSDVLESFASQMGRRGINPDLDVPSGTMLVADREMFRRALLHLVWDAMEAMPHGGELDVTCWNGPAGLELEVADSGPDVDEAAQTRILAPRASVKQAEPGQAEPGNNLAAVRQIVQVHGGHVTAANCPQGGAAFTLVFPPRSMEAAA